MGIGVGLGQVSEINGVVRIEAETSTNRTARTLGGVSYAWTNAADMPGFSGTGYIEAADTVSTNTTTVTSSWETTSPQINYTVTFSNPGTYYVWIRGFAGDASLAGVYVALS